MRDKIINILIGFLFTMASTAFGWAWKLNTEVAVMKENRLHDKASIETANDVVKDWSKQVQEVEALKNQMSKMWELRGKDGDDKADVERRLSRVEIIQESCCE